MKRFRFGRSETFSSDSASDRGAGTPKQKKTNSKKHPVLRAVGRWVGRCFSILGILLLCAAVLLVGAVAILCKGPSRAAAELFVNSAMETSAAKFVPRVFFSQEEVDRICRKYAVIETEEVTDPSVPFQPQDPTGSDEPIEIHDVSGATFKGKMMIVKDPSRVKVATLDRFDGSAGKTIEQFYADSGAIAAINAGGFYDAGGQGNGGTPTGIVIVDSKLVYGSTSTWSTVIGFDKDDHLVVGRMSGQQALDRGIRDAISFGPVFIVNGKPLEVTGSGGGLNPRTVIGQRADGAVLLLVIDGRQASSLGASYKDCIDVMMQFEAVNAANLDGGSSSMMMYNGETLNVSASLYGSRTLPDAIVVMPE